MCHSDYLGITSARYFCGTLSPYTCYLETLVLDNRET
jgi:hypothetical protein